jgi:hypothetical protein
VRLSSVDCATVDAALTNTPLRTQYVLPAYCVVFMLGILLGAALSPATPDELQWLSERAARLEARATAGRAAGSSGLARPAHALLARDSDAAAEAGGGGAGQGWQAGGSGGASSEALVDGGARGDESGGPQYLEVCRSLIRRGSSCHTCRLSAWPARTGHRAT